MLPQYKSCVYANVFSYAVKHASINLFNTYIWTYVSCMYMFGIYRSLENFRR